MKISELVHELWTYFQTLPYAIASVIMRVWHFFYKFGSVAKLEIRINQNALLTQDRDRYEKVNKKNEMKIGQFKHLL